MNTFARAVSDNATVAIHIALQGRVQGLGVRPAIARFAASLDLTGFVSNGLQGVTVHAEGRAEAVHQFRRELSSQLPDAAVVTGMHVRHADVIHNEEFTIQQERQTRSDGPPATHVPRDTAVCEECSRELNEADNRRQGYALTSCAACGPRYSVIEQMPYERLQTVMRHFPLCARCEHEYVANGDRRFHAQTTCCPVCGPGVWYVDHRGESLRSTEAALRRAVADLNNDLIVAVKGLGGYQLVCDATSESAVLRLRLRKHRPSKPLAVMVDSLTSAQQFAKIDACECRALQADANAIVLVEARSRSPLASTIHPGIGTLGLMLPTTPLHRLLSRETGRPLVVTSGNKNGAPLEFVDAHALVGLSDVADAWLQHDREIVRPVDDSVVRCMGRRSRARRCVSVRAARGLTPLPVNVPAQRHLLAVGGQQKVSVALSNGQQCILGPYIGDLDTVGTRARFVEQVRALTKLYGCDPEMIVHDRHPDYFTTRWAQEQGIRTLAVQHHHAHVVAGMVEHGWLEREVLGVAFDGTGWGTDDTIWGGEFLLATATGFRRVAHMGAFLLPGGEAAIRQPWRVATALLSAALGETVAHRWAEQFVTSDKASAVSELLQRPHLSPRTTSVGRLFDGVAAIILSLENVTFEGEAAMQLESIVDNSAVGVYSFSILEDEPLQIDWRPMVAELHRDHTLGVPAGTMSARFHRGLARVATEICRRFGAYPVVVSGGCFQNRILTELLEKALVDHVQPIGFPETIPPNDGGLAVGQLAIADAIYSRESSEGTEKCV